MAGGWRKAARAVIDGPDRHEPVQEEQTYWCYPFDTTDAVVKWAKRMGLRCKVRREPNPDPNAGFWTNRVTLYAPVGAPRLPKASRGGITADWGASAPWGQVPPVYYRGDPRAGQSLEDELTLMRREWEEWRTARP